MFCFFFVFCVEVAFFSLVAGMSVVSGFATTLILAKRRDSEMFDKVRKSFHYADKLDLIDCSQGSQVV